uniref:Retrovirus-related Pol polyprotein from transposon TNT 1-94 n=1 Tax=Brassica oleracea var. oleracea TaxID=109376 RepID=A0A0D3B8Y5_BRAOL
MADIASSVSGLEVHRRDLDFNGWIFCCLGFLEAGRHSSSAEQSWEQKPEKKTDEEWKLQHRQVCGLIRQWVDDNVLHHIETETDARSLWKKLEQLYARKTGNNKMYMIKKLIELRYQEGTSMTDHLNAFQGLLNKLSDMGIKFDDEIHGLWLLGTLPDSWEVFRMSLCNSASEGVISMDSVKNNVLNEEARRQSNASRGEVQVEIPRGTRTGAGASLIDLQIWSAISVIRKGT